MVDGRPEPAAMGLGQRRRRPRQDIGTATDMARTHRAQRAARRRGADGVGQQYPGCAAAVFFQLHRPGALWNPDVVGQTSRDVPGQEDIVLQEQRVRRAAV